MLRAPINHRIEMLCFWDKSCLLIIYLHNNLNRIAVKSS